MQEKRKFRRFPFGLNAQYACSSEKSGHCKLIDISREGLAIHLHMPEKISADTKIVLLIDCPSRAKPIQCLVHLKWIKKLESKADYNYKAGGEFVKIEPDSKTSLLELAYGSWYKKV